MNGTQTSSCLSNPTAEKIGKTFAYCLIFVVSLAGNTVIGITLHKTKTMRKPINFFIVNMAMSDLLFSIFIIPQDIQKLYDRDSWFIDGPLCQALCKLTYFLSDVSVIVSIQSLVLIAVDRFGAVAYPLRSPLISSKLCPYFILAIWMVAMAVGSPELVAVKLVEYPGGLVCKRCWNEAFGESSSFENYYFSGAVVFIFIPLVLIAILYITIYIKLKLQKIPGQPSTNAGQQRRLQRERSVLKMAIAVVLGFAVCLLPFGIASSFVPFESDIRTCGFQIFYSVGLFMLRANCAINPSICFIFSRNYREGFKTLFR